MFYLVDATAFWHELVARPSGPLALRFYLQPATAALLALRDGMKDARTGRSPYLWTILHDRPHRNQRLREGIVACARVLLLGVAMDLIYQALELHAFRPVQTIIVTLTLAFIPYLILRGPVARIGRYLIQRRAARHETGAVHRS